MLDENQFEKELEKLYTVTGVKVTIDGKKVKGRHRKIKEEIAA